MTKKQITETIQQFEAAAFREMHEHRDTFGPGSIPAVTACSRWAAIHDVMDVVGIKADNMLPDNIAAFEMRCSAASIKG